MRLTVLGSGGFMPQPGIAMPAFVVEHQGNLYLFDCGENTQVRLAENGFSAGRISAVMVSHLHGDHVLGLPGVLIRRAREGGEEDPLDLFGPESLSEYTETVRRTLGYELTYDCRFRTLEDRRRYGIDQFQLTVRRLEHRAENYGFSFEWSDKKRKFHPKKARQLGIPEGPKWSQLQDGESVTLEDGTRVQPEQVSEPRDPGPRFVYVTDTRPVYDYPDEFYGPDLLVHEGMFAAEHQDHAYSKKHSTAREAARVATELEANQLLLTHFSQRYDDPARLLEEARDVFGSTELAVAGESYDLEE